MSRVINDIKVEIEEELEEKLAWLAPNYGSFHVLKKSVDARRRTKPHFVYSVEIFDPGESPKRQEFLLEKVDGTKTKPEPVLIIGSGPAGFFAALRLSERGIPSTIFEQGSECAKRLMAITKFWRYGTLNLRDNVGFGEGGAGLYSDGKLITRIKSPHIPYVMDRLVQFGAPEEILYLANPHVGSDKIRRVIPVMRKYLLENGVQIHFNTKVTKLLSEGKTITGVQTEEGREFRSSQVILATGHSSEDMFDHLRELGVHMEGKSFAVGLRLEHPQKWLNQIQYREYAEHPKLGAANYKLAHHNKKTDVGVYSFCMCPGGYVLSSSTDELGLVSNGMSNYNRNSAFANAAIVVTVDHDKRFGKKEVFAGMQFRQDLEKRALEMVRQAKGTKQLPAQTLGDFVLGQVGETQATSCPSGVVASPLHELLPEDLNKEILQGLEKFDRDMRGFMTPEAQLHGVESRTSCPIRITRDDNSLQSLSHAGLFPCGEGAGYAGGITSAACDGVRIAEVIYENLRSQRVSAE